MNESTIPHSNRATALLPQVQQTSFWNAVTSGTNFPGEIAEYIIYNRDLTLTQIQSVEAYLHTKWGV